MSSFLGGGGGGSSAPPVAGANLDFYVATTGSDSNPGTIGSPFATIQHAIIVATSFNWIGGFVPTIHIAAGTYTENNIQVYELVNLQESKSGNIVGAGSATTTVQDVPGNGVFYGTGPRSNWTFAGIGLDTPFKGFSPTGGATFTILSPGINFTDSTAGNNCTIFNVQNLGTMQVFGNVTITGSVGGDYAFVEYSSLFDQDSTTVTCPATLPNLDFIFSGNQSTAYFVTTGVVNGSGIGGWSCQLQQGGIVVTDHGLVTDLPGSFNKSSIDASSAVVANTSAFNSKAITNTLGGASGKVEKSINTVTGNYTIDFPDAGNIIQGNSASAITITVPLNSTKAFPVGVIIEIAQINTGNVLTAAASGVTLVSIDNTFDVGAINGTSFLEKVGTNSWRFSRILGVPLAGFNRIWWVATTGSDSNPGTLALPFATMSFAAIIAATYNYENQFNPLINVEAGTYTAALGFVNLPVLLGGAFGTILGDATTPSNVVLNGRFACGAAWLIDGFQINIGDFEVGMNLLPFSDATFDDIIFNNTAGIGTSCVNISEYSQITAGATNFVATVIGNFNHLIFIDFWSDVLSGGITWNIGSATFSGRGGAIFALDGWCSIDASNGNMVFSGSTTGIRYRVEDYSILDGQGTPHFNRNTWPGNAKGFVDLTSFLPQDIQYAVTVPTSGGTVTATAGQHSVVLNPAGALATLTVNLPTDMSDAETYKISTSQMITALTIASTDGSSIVGPPTTLAAGSGFTMRFDNANTTWYIAA